VRRASLHKLLSLKTLYVTGFFFSAITAFTDYIGSGFLNQFISDGQVGMVFSLAAFVSLIALLILPRIVEKTGNLKVQLGLYLVNSLTLAGLALVNSPGLAAFFFILYNATLGAIVFGMDIFIEKLASHKSMGKVRGIILSINNLAYLIIPFFAGFFVDTLGFQAVFGLSAIISMLLLLTTYFAFRRFKDPKYTHKKNVYRFIIEMIHNKDLYRVYRVQLMMYMYFGLTAIYIPLYLKDLGFSWTAIGTLIALMHIPYITLDIPIGKMIDRYNSEKEVMVTGILIMGVAATSLFFIQSDSFILWALGLIATRVGASLALVSSESHFFKHVDAKDNEVIGLFRTSIPAAYILAPIMGSILVAFTDLSYITILMGILAILVLRFAIHLTSTSTHGKHKTKQIHRRAVQHKQA
jgi:MFS family permease